MTHLLSILVLLLKIRATRSCRGAPIWPAHPAPSLPTPQRRPPACLAKFRSLPAAAGISLKTQLLYLLVFVCRYLDLLYAYVSL